MPAKWFRVTAHGLTHFCRSGSRFDRLVVGYEPSLARSDELILVNNINTAV